MHRAVADEDGGAGKAQAALRKLARDPTTEYARSVTRSNRFYLYSPFSGGKRIKETARCILGRSECLCGVSISQLPVLAGGNLSVHAQPADAFHRGRVGSLSSQTFPARPGQRRAGSDHPRTAVHILGGSCRGSL